MSAVRPPRILVVEDDHTFAYLLAELLELEGYRAVCAHNGDEALRIIEHDGPPDLVLSDVMMPRLSGTELVDAIRRRYSPERLPIVLLSAGRDPGLAAERVWFMTKPVDFDLLLERIQSLVQGRPSDRPKRDDGDELGSWQSRSDRCFVAEGYRR